MPKTIKIVIDRIEEDKAVLVFDDGQKLIVPINSLPEKSLAGQALALHLSADSADAEKRESLARDVLNEILQN